jgi:hypothetical protein
VTRTFLLPPEAAAYLDSLRGELADLPPEEQEDLLADVEVSLHEAVEAGSLAALGSPQAFAAELRAAAGLEVRDTARRGPTLERVLAAARRIDATPHAHAARRALRELASLWWVARGYVAAAALALVAGASFSTSHQEIPRFGNGGVGLLVVLGLVGASVYVGLRSRRRPHSGRAAVAVANAILVVGAVPVLVHLVRERQPTPAPIVVTAPVVQGLAYNGVPISNVYPFGRDGRLLHDVLLYDGAGRPIDVGGPAAPDPNRRILVTRGGKQVYNSFPIRYYEPGTRSVAHPDVIPPLRIPPIVTPRLRSKRP